MRSIFDSHMLVVGKALDLQLQRQNVSMSNIANQTTQGYRPRKVEFEEQLQQALSLDAKGKVTRTDKHHFPGAMDINSFNSEWSKTFKPRVVYGEDRVNIDSEMATMAKTNLQYNALTTVMRSTFEGLRNIITEGQK